MYALKIYLFILALSFVFSSCNKAKIKDEILSGDLVFCSYNSGNLSEAIDAVTQTQENTNYSHMGIVEMVGQDTFIIHASSYGGVMRQAYATFLALDKPSKVDLYRLNEEYSYAVNAGVKKAKNKVGLPYNPSYVLSDSAYYCSQLVYQVFEDAKVFKLEPMTFKEAGSISFNKQWLAYYEKLGIPIPEGAPGCNPNGMAISENIQFVKNLK